MKFLQQREQAGHEFCFSLQAMQTLVHGNRFQPRFGNRLAAVAAHAVGALFDARKRLLDGLQNLRVGLLQLQLNVDFVVPARLIRHVALARVVLHRRLQRLDASGADNLAALSQQRVLVLLHVHVA